MNCILSTDSKGDPLNIISSSDESGKHLLKMEYVKVKHFFKLKITVGYFEWMLKAKNGSAFYAENQSEIMQINVCYKKPK